MYKVSLLEVQDCKFSLVQLGKLYCDILQFSLCTIVKTVKLYSYNEGLWLKDVALRSRNNTVA